MSAQRDDETALDALQDRLEEAIETAMWTHQSLDGDTRCSCGVRDNMDGDVLDGHRTGVVAAAAWSVVEALGLTPEWKVLFPMHGDYLHSDPTPFPPRYATDDGEQVQTRLVTKWEQI